MAFCFYLKLKSSLHKKSLSTKSHPFYKPAIGHFKRGTFFIKTDLSCEQTCIKFFCLCFSFIPAYRASNGTAEKHFWLILWKEGFQAKWLMIAPKLFKVSLHLQNY